MQIDHMGQVLYTLALPIAKLAFALDLPLDKVVESVQSAYFAMLRSRGFKLDEIAERFGTSTRTVRRIHKQQREMLLDDDRDYDLAARIEFMVAAEKMSRMKIKQLLPHTDNELIDETIDRLIADKHLIVENGRTPLLTVAKQLHLLHDDELLARLGGLNIFLENLSDAVYGRFFQEEHKRALARTIEFQIPVEKYQELGEFFTHSLLKLAIDLDAEANSDQTTSESVRLSICWAPYDYLYQKVTKPKENEQ